MIDDVLWMDFAVAFFTDALKSPSIKHFLLGLLICIYFSYIFCYNSAGGVQHILTLKISQQIPESDKCSRCISILKWPWLPQAITQESVDY